MGKRRQARPGNIRRKERRIAEIRELSAQAARRCDAKVRYPSKHIANGSVRALRKKGATKPGLQLHAARRTHALPRPFAALDGGEGVGVDAPAPAPRRLSPRMLAAAAERLAARAAKESA